MRAARGDAMRLTGFLVRAGERIGVPVPTCNAVYRLTKDSRPPVRGGSRSLDKTMT